MDPAAPFGGRNALYPMTADLVVEAMATLTLDLEANGLEARALTQPFRASCSTLGASQAEVSVGQFDDKQAGVIATFAGTNFNDAFHDAELLET